MVSPNFGEKNYVNFYVLLNLFLSSLITLIFSFIFPKNINFFLLVFALYNIYFILVYLIWYLLGRDPDIKNIPEYLHYLKSDDYIRFAYLTEVNEDYILASILNSLKNKGVNFEKNDKIPKNLNEIEKKVLEYYFKFKEDKIAFLNESKNFIKEKIIEPRKKIVSRVGKYNINFIYFFEILVLFFIFISILGSILFIIFILGQIYLIRTIFPFINNFIIFLYVILLIFSTLLFILYFIKRFKQKKYSLFFVLLSILFFFISIPSFLIAYLADFLRFKIKSVETLNKIYLGFCVLTFFMFFIFISPILSIYIFILLILKYYITNEIIKVSTKYKNKDEYIEFMKLESYRKYISSIVGQNNKAKYFNRSILPIAYILGLVNPYEDPLLKELGISKFK